MPNETILRIPRNDDVNDFVLVNVTDKGPHILKLVGTEGQAKYSASLKKSRIQELRSERYHGSEEEWASILASSLGQRDLSSIPDEWKAGIEMSATIKQFSSGHIPQQMRIFLRKRVESIPQPLGSITLEQDDEETVELFDWAGIAVRRADRLDRLVSSLTKRKNHAEQAVSRLKEASDELVYARYEHDNQLMYKFSGILNEKKSDIRKKQRLLSTVTGDLSNVDAAIGKTDLKCSNSLKCKEGLGCIDSGNDAFDANAIDDASGDESFEFGMGS